MAQIYDFAKKRLFLGCFGLYFVINLCQFNNYCFKYIFIIYGITILLLNINIFQKWSVYSSIRYRLPENIFIDKNILLINFIYYKFKQCFCK